MTGAVAVHLCRGREWRGGERQVQLLIRTLARDSGFVQQLVTARNSRLASAVGSEGPPVVGVPWRSPWDPRALLQTVSHLRRLRDRHRRDLLLHAHDSHALLIGLLAARFLGLPLVATRRSVTPPGRAWRLPDRVIAISTAVEEALRAARVARTASSGCLRRFHSPPSRGCLPGASSPGSAGASQSYSRWAR